MGIDFLQFVRIVEPDDDRAIDAALTDLWLEITYKFQSYLEAGLDSTTRNWNDEKTWKTILDVLDDIDELSRMIGRWNGTILKLDDNINLLWRSLLSRIALPEHEPLQQDILRRMESTRITANGTAHCRQFDYPSPRSVILREHDKPLLWTALYKSWDYDTDGLSLHLDDIVDEGGRSWNTPEDWNYLHEMMSDIERLMSAMSTFFDKRKRKEVDQERIHEWHRVIQHITASDTESNMQSSLLFKLHRIYSYARPMAPA